MLRSTSMSTFAFVSTTCDPSRFPLGPTTPSVQLDACASSPMYLSVGVLPIWKRKLCTRQDRVCTLPAENANLASG
jgi:hypothetical protein